VFTGSVRNGDHGGPTRRDLLRVGVGLSAGLLAGCGIFDSDRVEPAPDPLLPLLTQARDLVAAYDGFLAAHPDRAARLQPVREAHAAHVTALAAVVVQPSSAPAASPSPAPATIAQLKALESAAAKAAYTACLASTDDRVTLVGEIAAARATHVVVIS
jgi:negative regulator of sigma E activity